MNKITFSTQAGRIPELNFSIFHIRNSIDMRFILLLLALIIKCSVTLDILAQNSYLFQDVTVVTMKGEDDILKRQSVLVEDGVVKAIGKAKDIEAPNATVIDARGKFLIPGLAEMHAHVPPARAGEEYVHEVLFLYLAGGVTTIRGMLGEESHLELRDNIQNGDVLGPRFYTSGPSLNGNSVTSVEQAREKVTAQKEAGYDFLKLHPGLTMEVFDEIVRTASEVGIPYAGHVSLAVGIRHALQSQYASVDHIDGYVEGLYATDPDGELQNGLFGFDLIEDIHEEWIPDLVQLTLDQGIWIVPTQSLLDRWLDPSKTIDDYRAEEAMQYISNNTRANWSNAVIRFRTDEGYTEEKAHRFIEVRQKLLRDLHEAGVGMLLGSDAPQILNVPGFSIHNEIQSMKAAGLSNYDILESGTVNPAKFFGRDDFGTIEVGNSADFVLCDDNPLADISTIRNHDGVMVRGHWLPREELDARLAEIAEKYREN
jgi:imidazolonepropionase-like amidohydrolase